MPKLLSIYHQNLDLNTYKQECVDGFIVCCKDISRRGNLTQNEALKAVDILFQEGFKVYLQCDVLVTENDFKSYVKNIEKLISEKVSAIRVQDLGVANYFNGSSNIDLHLILETGNHNFQCLSVYFDLFKKKLVRVVLSYEMSKDILESWIRKIKIETEILVLGPLLLFYTPRKLLSGISNNKKESISAKLESSQLGFSGEFPLEQTEHGAFFYHAKDYSTLSNYRVYKDMEMDVLRWDSFECLNSDQTDLVLNVFKNGKGAIESFKLLWNKPTIPGFFQKNKTVSRFYQLKNQNVQDRNKDLVAEVIDSKKDQYLVLFLYEGLVLGQTLFFANPSGQTTEYSLKTMTDINDNRIDKALPDDIIIVPHIKKNPVTTLVYITKPVITE